MPYLVVDKDETEWIFNEEPIRITDDIWEPHVPWDDAFIELPKGSIEKLIGKVLTWDDDPIEI